MANSTTPAASRPLDDAFALALANLMQVYGHSQGISQENAAAQQSQTATVAQASLTQGIMHLYSGEVSADVLNSSLSKEGAKT